MAVVSAKLSQQGQCLPRHPQHWRRARRRLSAVLATGAASAASFAPGSWAYLPAPSSNLGLGPGPRVSPSHSSYHNSNYHNNYNNNHNNNISHSNFGSSLRSVRSSRGSLQAGGSSGDRSWASGPPFVALLSLGLVLLLAPPAMAAVGIVSPDLGNIWGKAAGSAFKGGTAGLLAGVLQVFSFMWLRTAMNYQYFNGGSLQTVLQELWSEGGIGRLYQGVSLALIQAPLSRFGDTAANAGVLVLMDFYAPDAPLALKTALSSTAASLWRFLLTPIDTLKTARQVRGGDALEVLMERVQEKGIGQLYSGAVASFAASWVGNYPYFVVFNTLSESWPAPEEAAMRIVRFGVLGMCSSIVSDVTSNALRVLKTIRQGSRDGEESYFESAKRIVDRDGWAGLFGRGLETRLLTNVLQGTFFTIIWKLIESNMMSQ